MAERPIHLFHFMRTDEARKKHVPWLHHVLRKHAQDTMQTDNVLGPVVGIHMLLPWVQESEVNSNVVEGKTED